MIKRRSRFSISSNTNRIHQFYHSISMAANSSFQMLALRPTASNSSSPAIDLSNGRFFVSNVLRNSNNDSVRNNGGQKPRAYAPCLPNVVAVDQTKTLNNNRGFSTGFRNQNKVMVAVDVDEVLGNFVSALNQFVADRYSLNHSITEYHVYEFFKIWRCSRAEADIRVHEFFKTPYFKKGIYPIPGARKALQKLSQSYNLSIVTSRQNVIKDHTIEWIETHYPGLFQEIHFGNHFALDGTSRSKSDICKSLGAKVLIDDNPRYAIECAQEGIKVLLFDYENSYPWCKTDNVCQHPLVDKVHNWEEVEHQLASMVSSENAPQNSV